VHIIVDGYNFIRQSESLRLFERISLDRGRQELVRRLCSYRKLRPHRITVVFDGWLSGPPSEERDREGGIDIIYSRRGEKADDVIKRIARHAGEEIVAVTSDRGIQDAVIRCGGAAISSQDFEERMARAGMVSPSRPASPPSVKPEEPDERDAPATKKKGPSRRMPKKKRIERTRLKKL